MKITLSIVILLISFTFCYAQLQFDIETGIANTGYNDVRIPGKGESTKFSFVDDLSSDNVFTYRFNLHYYISQNHRLSLVYAPLTIKPAGTFDNDVTFEGKVFSSGDKIKGLYRFDSYRLQYRYYFENQEKLYKAIGVTAKIRDAEISLESPLTSSTKTNTGFVPIINFLLSHTITPGLDIIMDGDALFSPYGRAADVLLALDYKYNDNLSFRGGYRILECGSDVDEVYTFALINYFVLNIRLTY